MTTATLRFTLNGTRHLSCLRAFGLGASVHGALPFEIGAHDHDNKPFIYVSFRFLSGAPNKQKAARRQRTQ